MFFNQEDNFPFLLPFFPFSFFLSFFPIPAGILEMVATSSYSGSSRPRDPTHVSSISCIADQFFTTELPGKRLGMSRGCLISPMRYDGLGGGGIYQEMNNLIKHDIGFYGFIFTMYHFYFWFNEAWKFLHIQTKKQSITI